MTYPEITITLTHPGTKRAYKSFNKRIKIASTGKMWALWSGDRPIGYVHYDIVTREHKDREYEVPVWSVTTVNGDHYQTVSKEQCVLEATVAFEEVLDEAGLL